jgi:hypothetical protein
VPGVLPDHAGMVAGVDFPPAGDRDDRRLANDRNQRRRVVVLIFVSQFGRCVIVLHLPGHDFLTLRFLGRQAQALQRVDNRFGEAIAGGVADGEAHQDRNL